MAKSDVIKKTWIVCGLDGNPLYNSRADRTAEFATAKAAIKRAKEHVQESEDTEAWVYVLSHVVARPTTDPTVDVIK